MTAAPASSIMQTFIDNDFKSYRTDKMPGDTDTLFVYEEHIDIYDGIHQVKTTTYINNCLAYLDFDYIGYYLLEVGDQVKKDEPCNYCDHPQNTDGHCFMCYEHPGIQKNETWITYLFLHVHAGEWQCEWLPDVRPMRFFQRELDSFEIIRRFVSWAEGRDEERRERA